MLDVRSFARSAALSICACLALAPAAHADVHLTLRDGRVTLVAKDATLRQILAEWSRVGKVKVVNLERIPGPPLTLEFHDVPEGEALDVLLRTLSGYIAAPRTALVADASIYDSISVMPTIAAPPTRTVAPAPAPAPFAPAGAFVIPGDDDQNVVQPPIVRPPAFAPFQGQQSPQPGNANVVRPVLPVVRPGVVQTVPNTNQNEGVFPVPAPLPVPNVAPAAPGGQPTPGAIGVSAPGMVVPAPATSQPGQVPQPQRPPGD